MPEMREFYRSNSSGLLERKNIPNITRYREIISNVSRDSSRCKPSARVTETRKRTIERDLCSCFRQSSIRMRGAEREKNCLHVPVGGVLLDSIDGWPNDVTYNLLDFNFYFKKLRNDVSLFTTPAFIQEDFDKCTHEKIPSFNVRREKSALEPCTNETWFLWAELTEMCKLWMNDWRQRSNQFGK